MNKLQLYITINYKQYQQMLDIDKDEQVNKHVADLSNAVGCITYDEHNKEIFYLLKYIDKGVFLVILRTIPADSKSHLAAWIFIPAEVEITDIDLDAVVKNVVSIISKPSIKSDDVHMLQDIFRTEYPTQSIYGATLANQGAGYAHRFYGGNTGYELIDFLGNMRYQTSYLPFAGMLLVDRDITDDVQGTDLTDEPLNQMVKVFPPKTSSTTYKPYIFGEAFDRPLLVPLMCTVEILWKSETALDKHQSIMISHANMRIEAPAESTKQAPESAVAETPATSTNADTIEPAPIAESLKERAAEMLADALESSADSELTSVSPMAENEDTIVKDIAAGSNVGGSPAPLAETAVKPVESESQATNTAVPKVETLSEPIEKEPKTVGVERPNGLPQNPGPHVYKFELPAKSADIAGMIKFTVTSRNPLQTSPIDGYTSDGELQEGNRINYLKYNGSDQMHQRLLWGGGGLVIGILATLLCVLLFSSGPAADTIEGTPNDSTAITEQKIETDPKTPTEAKAETETAAKDTSLAAAIAYLDTNKVWEKNEMEQYPDLRGLYNDMNTFNRDRLVKHWGKKLKESRKFGSVVEHAKYGKKKKVRVPAGQKTFNVGKDTSIKVQNYLNTIDP